MTPSLPALSHGQRDALRRAYVQIRAAAYRLRDLRADDTAGLLAIADQLTDSTLELSVVIRGDELRRARKDGVR